LAGTSATQATVATVVYNLGLVQDCQAGNRLAYLVTLTNPGESDPISRVIDPGHGGIIDETSGVYEVQDIASYSWTTEPQPVLVKATNPPFTIAGAVT